MNDHDGLWPDPLDSWRLCAELSIHEAALLQAGMRPEGNLRYGMKSEPHGYRPALEAISRALRNDEIEGRLVLIPDDYDGIGMRPVQINELLSLVNVESLKSWLASRGVQSGFFFPKPPPSAGYLDPLHERYAPKLAAAVHAWLAMEEGTKLNGTTPKKALDKWTREHAAQFGLTDAEGKPIKEAVEQISIVANWKTLGGAPKTPG